MVRLHYYRILLRAKRVTNLQRWRKEYAKIRAPLSTAAQLLANHVRQHYCTHSTYFFPWRLLRAKRLKPSQRHSPLRGMDAHHVFRSLNPNASYLQAMAASLAECTHLQQPPSELATDRASKLAADRARDRARADAQRQDEQDRVRERLRSASRRQSAGGVGLPHGDSCGVNNKLQQVDEYLASFDPEKPLYQGGSHGGHAGDLPAEATVELEPLLCRELRAVVHG